MPPRYRACRLSLLAALLLSLTACARTSTVAPRAGSAPPPTPGLFLYEVRGEHGAAHLLGTIHLGFGFDEVLTPEARRRFRASTRVMTEADVSASDASQLMRAALLPPGESLRELLPDATWQALVARLGEQLPPPVLDRLEPWLPTVMLGLEQLEEALAREKPGATQRMMDLELTQAARRLEKPVSHFETVAEQIAVFDGISLEAQVRELAHALEQPSGAPALLRAFARGDEEALTRALFETPELAAGPTFYERVLFERNARWLPRVEREIALGGAFIAVGAAHLLGERGILAELRRRGYGVQRVGGGR